MQARFICPYCKSSKNVDIPDEQLENQDNGLLHVSVEEGFVCCHPFRVFVDKNGVVRGIERTDVVFRNYQTPSLLGRDQNQTQGKNQSQKTTLREIDELITHLIDPEDVELDVKQVKLNIPFKCMSYVIRSIMLGKEIILLFKSSNITFLSFDNPFIAKQIYVFLDYATQFNFRYALSLRTEKDDLRDEFAYEDPVVLFGDSVISNHKKILHTEELEIVKEFVKKFYEQGKGIVAINALRIELDKTYKLSKLIVEFFEEKRNVKKVSVKEIQAYLKEKHDYEIPFKGIKYLLEIVAFYFECDMPKIYY